MQEKHDKKLLVIGAVLLLVVMAWLAVLSNRSAEQEEQGQEQSQIEEETEQTEEVTETEDEIEEEESLPEAKIDEPVVVPLSDRVVISSTSVSGTTLSVRGYVTSVIEDNGTCLFSLVDASGNEVSSVANVGLADASSTSCGRAQIDVSGLSGTYTVRLTYSSDNFQEQAAQTEVEL